MLDLPPFPVLNDGEKIAFLMDALAEATDALNVANELNQELHKFNGELIAAIKGAESNV